MKEVIYQGLFPIVGWPEMTLALLGAARKPKRKLPPAVGEWRRGGSTSAASPPETSMAIKDSKCKERRGSRTRCASGRSSRAYSRSVPDCNKGFCRIRQNPLSTCGYVAFRCEVSKTVLPRGLPPPQLHGVNEAIVSTRAAMKNNSTPLHQLPVTRHEVHEVEMLHALTLL